MNYDTTLYITELERTPGWHDVVARVCWTPRGGEPITTVGDFLDANAPGTEVFLACGIDMIGTDLGLTDVIEDHIIPICDLVNAQLRKHPWAEIRCPLGTTRLELVKR